MSCSLRSLPVLMYHYVSAYPNSIAMPPALFEEQCKVLTETGWRGVGLDEAEAFLLKGEALPPKSCLFTFDDGYLDNYTHAWPILEKYGHKGVVFAVLERLEGAGQGESLPPRQTLADAWAGRCRAKDLPRVDSPMIERPQGYSVREDQFLRWSEGRRMEESGVMRVAAHSLRHDWVYAGEAFKAFFKPGEQPRTFYRCWPEQPWGMPLLETRRELTGPAFIPHEALFDAIRALVPQDEAGAWAFFQQPDAEAALCRVVEEVRQAHGGLGRMETPKETGRRYEHIMEQCSKTLRAELGHDVCSFCWPWGLFDERARTAGQKAGFEVFFTTEYGVNPPGKPLAVHRFKAKSKSGAWLKRRLELYSRPLLGKLYTKLRF